MDQLLLEAAKQIPALAILVWVVIHFLKHLERVQDMHAKREAEHAKRDDERLEALRDALAKNAGLYEQILVNLKDIGPSK